MDYRNKIDNEVKEHFKDNPAVVINDMHDDFAVAYVYGKQYNWGYYESLESKEIINQIENLLKLKGTQS